MLMEVWVEAVAATGSLVLLMLSGCLLGYLASVYLKPKPMKRSYFDVAGGSRMVTSFIHIDGETLSHSQVTPRKLIETIPETEYVIETIPETETSPYTSVTMLSAGDMETTPQITATSPLPHPPAELLRDPSIFRGKKDRQLAPPPPEEESKKPGSPISPPPPMSKPPPLRDTLYPDDPMFASPEAQRKNINTTVTAFDNELYAVPSGVKSRPDVRPPPPPPCNNAPVSKNGQKSPISSSPKPIRAGVAVIPVTSPQIPRAAKQTGGDNSSNDTQTFKNEDVPSDDDSIY